MGIALFETQAAGQDQRLVAGEEVHEIAFEDHHALGMDRAAQFGLPLQVHDAAMPHADGAGNLVWQAHDVFPDLGHGQPVGHTHAFALGADFDGPAVVFPQELFLIEIGAVFAFVQGFLDDAGVDDPFVLTDGDGVGLHHDLAEMRKMKRQAFAILGHAGGVVHELGVGVLGEAAQAGFAGGAVQGLGIPDDGLGSALDRVLDVGLELEYLPEALVVHVQEFVRFVVADEDDLQGQRDRVRADGARAQDVVVVRGVVEA